jgi:hypothetical protein
MKKVAILISGLPRNYDNYQNIKKYLIDCNPNYEFSIFLGLWNKNIINVSKTIDTGMDKVMEDINIENVIKEYNPTSYVILDVITSHNMFKNNIIDKILKNYITINIPTIYNPVLSQLYCVYQTFKNYNEYINSKQLNYDIIIRYRFDLFTSEPIILDNLVHNHICAIRREPYFPDWLFIGTFEHMKHIFNSYEYFINCIFDKSINIPELIFKNACDINKIAISYTIPDTFYINKNMFEPHSVSYEKWNGI